MALRTGRGAWPEVSDALFTSASAGGELRLSVKGVFRESFRFYRRHFWTLSLVAGLFFGVLEGTSLFISAILGERGELAVDVFQFFVGIPMFYALQVAHVVDVEDGRADMSATELLRSLGNPLGSVTGQVASLLTWLAIPIGIFLGLVPGLLILTFAALNVPARAVEGGLVDDPYKRTLSLLRVGREPLVAINVLVAVGLFAVTLHPADQATASIYGLGVAAIVMPFIVVVWTMSYRAVAALDRVFRTADSPHAGDIGTRSLKRWILIAVFLFVGGWVGYASLSEDERITEIVGGLYVLIRFIDPSSAPAVIAVANGWFTGALLALAWLVAITTVWFVGARVVRRRVTWSRVLLSPRTIVVAAVFVVAANVGERLRETETRGEFDQWRRVYFDLGDDFGALVIDHRAWIRDFTRDGNTVEMLAEARRIRSDFRTLATRARREMPVPADPEIHRLRSDLIRAFTLFASGTRVT